MPARIITALELLSLAAHRALSVQIVIAAAELMQFEFEGSAVAGTSEGG